MTIEHEAWDDARLSAAFVAAADAALPPHGLAASTIDAIRADTEACPWWRRPLPILGLTAAVVAVVAAVAIASWPLASTPSPGGGEPRAEATSTPSGQPPTTVLGLPVIDVPTAIEQRDATDDARELAVSGWYAPTYPVPCPFTPTTSPVQPACPDDQVLLLAQPETLATVGTNAAGTRTTGFRSPEGPSLQIDLDDVDRSWSPTLDDSPPPEPIELVALGHFADDRSALCSPETVGLCRDRFVVDQVVWADGREVPLSPLVDPAAAVSTVEDVLSAVRDAAGERPVLALMLIQGPDIRRAEPAHANHLELIARDGIWVARVLVGGVTQRFLVIDGSDAVFRVDGTEVTHVAGTVPSPLRPHARPDPATDFPTEVAGLPVMTVAAATDVQAHDGDDRELAIKGWLKPTFERGPMCIESSAPGPVLLSSLCSPIRRMILDDQREGDGNAITVVIPNPIPNDLGVATPVIAVGHFDDRRVSQCHETAQQACKDTFMVDGLWINGDLPDRDWIWVPRDGATPPAEATPDSVARTISSAGSSDDSQVLSVGLISGPELQILEPVTAGTALATAPWVWHVTLLSDDRVRTFLISDDDAVARREGRSNEWWEVIGDQVTGTGADIN
jgi:hypothetical protein